MYLYIICITNRLGYYEQAARDMLDGRACANPCRPAPRGVHVALTSFRLARFGSLGSLGTTGCCQRCHQSTPVLIRLIWEPQRPVELIDLFVTDAAQLLEEVVGVEARVRLDLFMVMRDTVDRHTQQLTEEPLHL